MATNWPTVSGEQLFNAIRSKGWRVLSSGERTIAEQGRGVVWIRLPFGPASQVKSRDVRRYAMMFGLNPINLEGD
jgi:hypothetical protein